MRKVWTYPVLILAILICALSCKSREAGKIIPSHTMARIFVDMFIADQWLEDNTFKMQQADTTLFYEPIFRNYGYTREDYLATVDKYLYEPEKFQKIVTEAVNILDDIVKDMDARNRMIERVTTGYVGATGYVYTDFTRDSLKWADSTVIWHHPIPTMTAVDSLLLGVEIEDGAIRDSLISALSSCDSLQRDSLLRDAVVRDSLRKDSLQADAIVRDSLRRDSLKRHRMDIGNGGQPKHKFTTKD